MITVAFDVDGCLRLPAGRQGYPVANEPVRQLLVILWHLPGVRIHVWSGSGELYARQVAAELGIRPYVHSYSSKTDPTIEPDITFDDEEMTRGRVNIRVP